jgi:TPR repeat protein
MKLKSIIINFLLLLSASIHAQTDKEKIDRGVRAYNENRFKDAVSLLLPLIKSRDLTGDAEYCIGSIYHYGEGHVKQDYELAMKFYKKAVSDGNADALEGIGTLYYYGYGVAKSEKEAIKWYRKSAEKGSCAGQNSLGYEYLRGNFLPKDYNEAIKWYRLSAAQSNLLGLEALGSIYLEGKGVPHDTVTAVKYYMEAVRQGAIQKPLSGSRSAYLLNRLGYSEISGKPFTLKEYHDLGIKKFKEQSYNDAFAMLSKVSSELGFTAEECNYLGYMYDAGLGTQSNPELAFKFYEKGSNMGNIDAAKNLGILYYHGRGVMQNYATALKWFLFAGAKGSSSAQNYAGIMYTRAEGCNQNYSEAIIWLQKAAAQGEAQAQTNLGIMYENGFGVPRNDTAAARWYSKATLQSDALGEYHLGLCWQNGIGVEKNYTKAQFLFGLASAQGNLQAQALYVKKEVTTEDPDYDYKPSSNYTQSSHKAGRIMCTCCRGAGTKITYMSSPYQSYNKNGTTIGQPTHYINTACTCCDGTGVIIVR